MFEDLLPVAVLGSIYTLFALGVQVSGSGRPCEQHAQ